MVSINPANGPIPKPKRAVKPAKALQRGGRKPKEAGRRYEKSFADKYGFQRQVGSGAFGEQDPILKGDVKGDIGRLSLLFEIKSWLQLNGRGEKVVSFPVSLLDKISQEAKTLGKIPLFVYHVKNSPTEYAVVEYEWLHRTLLEQENTIAALTEQLLEKNNQ